MDYGLFMAHSGWRWIVIVVLGLALIRYVVALATRSQWTNLDDWLLRVTPIVLDIQVLLGLVLWIMRAGWMRERLVSIEHPVIMLLVVVAAHITSTRVRRATTDGTKFRTALIGFAITAVLLTVGILQITHVL
jgi:hypothetical protein